MSEKGILTVGCVEERPITVPIIPDWKDAQGSCVSCPVYHEKCEHWEEAHHLERKNKSSLFHMMKYFNINKIKK